MGSIVIAWGKGGRFYVHIYLENMWDNNSVHQTDISPRRVAQIFKIMLP